MTLETVAIESLKFDAKGLIPAIVQDAESDAVLMLAYMNAESLQIDIGNGRDAFLVTQPPGVVAQGRYVWKYPAGG